MDQNVQFEEAISRLKYAKESLDPARYASQFGTIVAVSLISSGSEIMTY